MALIKYIPNKFVDLKYEHEIDSNELVDALYKFTLYYPEHAKPIMGKKSAVFVNGRGLNHEECATCLLKEGDIVEITHTIEDPIALIIGVLIMAGMAGYLFYKIGAWFLDQFEWDYETDTGDSPTYGWDGPKTRFIAEKPVALIYGEHLIGGQYINFNVWSSGANNWLDILVALGEGEIAGVVDENQTGLVSMPTTLENVNTKDPYIKINNQLVTAYTNCLWAGRYGTNNQTAINGFRQQKSSHTPTYEKSIRKKIPAWTTPECTTNTAIDGFTVKLSCPSLFTAFDSGKIKAKAVHYRIRHRTNSPQGAWYYSPSASTWYTISAKSRSEVKEYKTITTASRDVWDIQIGRKFDENTDLSSKRTDENKLKVTDIVEIIDEELAFPNTALEAIRIKATDQISGSFPNVQTLIRGLKVRVPDLTNGGAGDKEFDDYYWTGTGHDFDLLVGSDPVTWNTTSYITQWTANPAYIIRDLMLNDRYGLGEVVGTTDIDDDSIDAAAYRCWQEVDSSHKHRLNVVIDTENDPTTILAQLSQISRIFVFWAGGYIKFKYEEDEDPIQLFTMGNIIKDSFKTDYTDYTRIPNRIEVTFADKDDGWKNNTIEVVDEAEWALGKPKRTKAISLIGVTDKAQALREAKFFLNKGRNVRKAIEFSTTIAACHSEPGDIIAFQHDVPQWGWGGRVLGGTSTTCIVDQDIPQNIIDDPTAYDIKIIHSDDTIETYDIVSVDGKTVTVGGGDTFSPVPTEDESYILGKEGSTIAEYRIQEVGLTSEEEVQIKATEHNAAIYSDTGLVISTDESTELPDPSAFAPQVSNLTLYELYNSLGFGISFRQPEDTLVFNRADIYISTDNKHFEKKAEGYGDDDVEYYDVFPGQTYYVKVYSINKIGIKNTSPATANIQVLGLGIPYTTSPTGLEIEGQGNNTEFSGRDCKIVWRLNAPFSGAGSLEPELPANIPAEKTVTMVKDFIVQVWNEAETTLLREEITTDKWYIYSWEKNFEDNSGTPVGSFVFKVFQRNYFGKISTVPARLAVSSDAPSAPTGLATVSEEDGVTFSWDESTLSDFDHYEYRTNIDSGSWSSWLVSYDNRVTRWLTGTEMANQGTSKSTVYIEARTVDIFNATSTAVSGNASCDNFKGYFTVSPTVGKGHFTTIASAISALSTNGGTIVLKEGTHSITSPITLPGKDITILGDSRDIAKIVPGAVAIPFSMYGKSNTYTFRDFTASWTNEAQPVQFISCNSSLYGAAGLDTNTAGLTLNNLKLIQMPSSTSLNEGVKYRGVGNFDMEKCSVIGGEKAVYAVGNNINVSHNIFDGMNEYNIELENTTASGHIGLTVIGNIFKTFKRRGIFILNGAEGANINNNTFTFNTATGGIVDMCGSSIEDPIPIRIIGLKRSTISDNNFIFVNASTVGAGEITQISGIYLQKCWNNSVSGNTIVASLNSDCGLRFIHCVASVYSTSIVGNTGVFLNSSINGNWYGMYLGGDAERNTVSANNFTFNNRAKDTGFYLGPTSRYNYGRSNLVWDAATGMDDNNSASNDVVATLT
jgi:hypothetical protein